MARVNDIARTTKLLLKQAFMLVPPVTFSNLYHLSFFVNNEEPFVSAVPSNCTFLHDSFEHIDYSLSVYYCFVCENMFIKFILI